MSTSSIQTYLNNSNRLLQTGNAREHSYRGDLQQLLNDIIKDDEVIVTNEPARIVKVGAPDYSITKNNIPIIVKITKIRIFFFLMLFIIFFIIFLFKKLLYFFY